MPFISLEKSLTFKEYASIFFRSLSAPSWGLLQHPHRFFSSYLQICTGTCTALQTIHTHFLLNQEVGRGVWITRRARLEVSSFFSPLYLYALWWKTMQCAVLELNAVVWTRVAGKPFYCACVQMHMVWTNLHKWIRTGQQNKYITLPALLMAKLPLQLGPALLTIAQTAPLTNGSHGLPSDTGTASSPIPQLLK